AADLLLAGGREGGIEGVEEAVGREQMVAVRRPQREQRGNRELGRERHRATDARGADGAVVPLVAECDTAGGVGVELATSAGQCERLVRRAVAGAEAPDVSVVAAPTARVRDRVGALRQC